MEKRTFAPIVGAIALGITGMIWAYGSLAYSASQMMASGPIEIQSSIKHGISGSPEISLTALNKATKDVMALTLLTTYFDAENKASGRLTTNQIFGLEARAPRYVLAPGDKWTPSKGLASPVDQSGTAARYAVSVDYVLFSDGSAWGPDQMKQSLHIAGVRQGWTLARSTLKGVLAKEGAIAVVAILNQEEKR